MKKDEYDFLIKRISKMYEIDWLRVKAVCLAESNMNPNAKSHCGAMGLMQIMPATAGDFGIKNPENLYVPEINIAVGVRYLNLLYGKYAEISDPDERWLFTHAAYNAGRGNINHAAKHELLQDGSCQTWDEAEEHLIEITGEEHSRETRGYIDHIQQFYSELQND